MTIRSALVDGRVDGGNVNKLVLWDMVKPPSRDDDCDALGGASTWSTPTSANTCSLISVDLEAPCGGRFWMRRSPHQSPNFGGRGPGPYPFSSDRMGREPVQGKLAGLLASPTIDRPTQTVTGYH